MPDKAKPDDPAQSQRFIDMAREVEVTDGTTEFEKLFERIVKSPSPSKKEP